MSNLTVAIMIVSGIVFTLFSVGVIWLLYLGSSGSKYSTYVSNLDPKERSDFITKLIIGSLGLINPNTDKKSAFLLLAQIKKQTDEEIKEYEKNKKTKQLVRQQQILSGQQPPEETKIDESQKKEIYNENLGKIATVIKSNLESINK